MLKNFLKVAWRSLLRQRLYTVINVLGLTIGIASTMLIYMFVQDELSYDKMHPDSEEIYRLSYWRKHQNGEIQAFATSGSLWGSRYQDLFPEVTDHAVLTHNGYPGYVGLENSTEVYMEPDLKWATDNFFTFFHYPLLQGSPKDVLSQRNSVVLTQTTARKYFGDDNPIGKTLVYNVIGEQALLEVTGIMEDPASNTHIKPTFVCNIQYMHDLYMKRFQYDFLNQDRDAFAFTYLKIADPRVIPRIEQDWKEHLSTVFANNQNVRADAYDRVKLTALHDMHFEPEMKWELESPGNASYIPIFALSALLVLIIACINFMNLATARSAKRAKEIGLRKTLGSSRQQIIVQFFGESFLMTLLAMVLAGLAFWLALPFFNEFTGKQFIFQDILEPNMVAVLVGVTLLVGILAGSYPALYLSGFSSMTALRGSLTSGRGAETVRKGLVVFQFAIATILIVSTLVVYNQMQLIHNSNLGQDKDRILSIRLGGFGLGNEVDVYRQQVLQDPRFEEITVANHLPRLPHFGLINQTFTLPERNNEQIQWNKFDVDFTFTDVFELEVIAGRTFDPMILSDSNGILVNESLVRSLNVEPDAVVGMTIVDQVFNQQLQQQVDLPGQIIGVVKDFPYKSVNTLIEPLVMWGTPSSIDRIMYVKMTPGEIDSKVQFLSNKWNEIIPGMPMESWFLDFEFGRLYENERRMSRIFLFFACITIFVAVLGLFALTSYTTEQRKKEIGVRKVLGASEGSLVGLLLGYFFKLILLSYLIAVPVAYYFMNNWLSEFVYRVNVSVQVLLTGAILVGFITLTTVVFETYKAAITNPIKTLRVD